MDIPKHPDLLVGLDTFDDAGIYRIRDDLALIQTVDFFTPIVDDPYSFGQIAAANALSDIYAMGGEPLTAMNIICFPITKMDISILQKILKGGLDKLKEAETLLVGGHSVEDDELKYGLSVTGTIHPDHILTNRGARVGDQLILTKPLGTGIINTAIKGNLVKEDLIQEVTTLMSSLNRTAAQEVGAYDIHACTDVTGFGLLGHVCEMIEGGKMGLVIYPSRMPFIREVLNFARMGIVPAGTHRNKDFRKDYLIGLEQTEPAIVDILFDPQTSGGLLIAVAKEQSAELAAKLVHKGLKDTSIVGEFVPEPKGKIIIENPI